MSDIAISIENLSKEYRLGVISTGTLSHDLNRWWARVRGKEDPNLKIGMENKLSEAGGEYIWALRDINLEVKKGEVLGIIGKNGAGKSTLLKILSRVTTPTTGTVKMHGRVASLLEVGTGFHPELTGRENIFLNGAILGMTKQEIKKKFDQVVDFAGVEKYIDTPVKRYSSGMYVRLAFAVAAHLEPEILVIDEVLAVGDAEFQKKALGKMQDVSRNDGRTVLFVSHNMAAVKNLCKKGVLLENGLERFSGEIDSVVNYYLTNAIAKTQENNYWKFDNAPGTEKVKVKAAYVALKGDKITVNTPFDIITEFWNLEEGFPVNVSMHLFDMSGAIVFNVFTKNVPLAKGLYKAAFHIPGNLMNDGVYYVQNMFVSNSRAHFIHDKAHSFEVFEEREPIGGWHGKWTGAVRPTFIVNDFQKIAEI